MVPGVIRVLAQIQSLSIVFDLILCSETSLIPDIILHFDCWCQRIRQMTAHQPSVRVWLYFLGMTLRRYLSSSRSHQLHLLCSQLFHSQPPHFDTFVNHQSYFHGKLNLSQIAYRPLIKSLSHTLTPSCLLRAVVIISPSLAGASAIGV